MRLHGNSEGPPSLIGPTVLQTLESLLIKAARGGIVTRIWTSFATPITQTSTKNNFASSCRTLLGANFDVVTDDGAMNIFHLKDYVLSLTQSGAAISNVSSGLISTDPSRHSCNECYVK